jgi:HEAT repeat protein
MKRLLLGAVLAALVCGCRPAQPPLAGGKPISYWVEAVGGPDAALRKKAVLKLGNVGATDAAVLPALLQALKDPEAGVRREAIVALMKYGPDAREANGTLAEMKQHDRDGVVRSYAARALEKLSASR